MKTKALVIDHYNFEKNGRKYEGYKFIINLGTYGSVYANGQSDDELKLFNEYDVIVSYSYGKWLVNEVIK